MDQLHRDLCKILPGVDCTLHSDKIIVAIGAVFTIGKSGCYYIISHVAKSFEYKFSYKHDDLLKYFRDVDERYQYAVNLRQSFISALEIFNLTVEIKQEMYFPLRVKFYDKIFNVYRFGHKLSIASNYHPPYRYISPKKSIKKIRNELLKIIVQDSQIKINRLQDEYLDLDFNGNLLNLVGSIIDQQTELLVNAV